MTREEVAFQKDQVLADFILNQGQHIRIQLNKANKVYAQVLDGKREVIQEIADKNIYFGLHKKQGEAVIKGLREVSPSKMYPVLHNGQLTLVLKLKGAMFNGKTRSDCEEQPLPDADVEAHWPKAVVETHMRGIDRAYGVPDPTGVTTNPYILEELPMNRETSFSKNNNSYDRTSDYKKNLSDRLDGLYDPDAHAAACPAGVRTHPAIMPKLRKGDSYAAKEAAGVMTNPATLDLSIDRRKSVDKNTNDRQTETEFTIGPCSQSEQKIVQNRSKNPYLETVIDQTLELLKKYPDGAEQTIGSLQHILLMVEYLCPEDKINDLEIQRKHLTSILKSKAELQHLKRLLRSIRAGDSKVSSIIGAHLSDSPGFEGRFPKALTKERRKAIEKEREKAMVACISIGANASPIGAMTNPTVCATTVKLSPTLKQEITGERLSYLITFREEALKCIERLSHNAAQEPNELQDTLTLIEPVCPEEKKQTLKNYCENLDSILKNEEEIKQLKTFLENII